MCGYIQTKEELDKELKRLGLKKEKEMSDTERVVDVLLREYMTGVE